MLSREHTITQESVVALRGHHLLCMLTWAGHGYTQRFTQIFDEVIALIRQGATIQIVDGPDMVCCSLDGQAAIDHDCTKSSVRDRAVTALLAIGQRLGRVLSVGDTLCLDQTLLDDWRIGFADGSLRAACKGCEWFSLCSDLASAGFCGTRLKETA